MTPYLLFFGISFILFIQLENHSIKNNDFFINLTLLSIITAFIGFRYSVGGDWSNYINNFESYRYHDYISLFNTNEILWSFLNVFSAHIGLGILGVNITSAFIVSYSILKLTRKISTNYFLVLFAIPYYINIVAMGYTRQSIAAAFLILSLCVDGKYKDLKIFLLLLVGLMFHNSIIFLAFLPFLYRPLITWGKITLIILGLFCIYYLYYRFSFSYYFSYFYDQKVISNGAIFRLFFNILASGIYIIFSYKFYKEKDFFIWMFLSIINLFFLICIIFKILPSGMIDRILVYSSIIHIVAYVKIYEICKEEIKNLFITSISFLFFLYSSFWFVFANNSQSWIPYQIKLYSEESWTKHRVYKFNNCTHCFNSELDKIKNKEYLFNKINNFKFEE